MKEYKYKINGNPYNVVIKDVEGNLAHVEVNGTPYKVELDKPVKTSAPKISRPAAAPRTATGAPVVTPAAKPVRKDSVKSPLPGVILEIKVKEGDTVKKGQTVIILEAMKMENNINANKDGKVVSICVGKGDSILEGADLVIIE
ncbi:MAG: biotin/lipoyl-binding protein [Prevotellaceae bacterium]|jgi:biotin carboxyl carrier protein|nr:biotin/lipoyl-binding protein [Prevotellaceae bacterium]